METPPLNRRRWLQLLASTPVLTACDPAPDPERYSQADRAQLLQQQANELAQSGTGPFGSTVFTGYRGLAELPWFELDNAGQLTCVDDSFAHAIDMHCHLGMSILFEPELDLQRLHPRTRHLLDCDATQPGCRLDLDVYINANFTEGDLHQLQRDLRSQAFFGSDVIATHTIANLLQEMDAMRVDQAVLLPIAFGLWFGDRQTELWRDAVGTHGTDRLINGFSVSPRADDPVAELEAAFTNGGRIMKLHPTVQRFYPDDPTLDRLYARAQELGVVVFFHGGRAGIEPESSQPFALPRHYEATFKRFPQLQCVIGHGGARDSDAMLALALRYPNVWLGTHGQGVTQLYKMIKATGGRQMLFGSDWPFYHIGASLAKILIVTESADTRLLRDNLLRQNALDLLASLAA